MSERPEGSRNPEKIASLNDLEGLVGRRVSVNRVGGGMENPHVLEGETRIVGILRKVGDNFWVDHKDGSQQITEWFLPFQAPQVEE